MKTMISIKMPIYTFEHHTYHYHISIAARLAKKLNKLLNSCRMKWISLSIWICKSSYLVVDIVIVHCSMIMIFGVLVVLFLIVGCDAFQSSLRPNARLFSKVKHLRCKPNAYTKSPLFLLLHHLSCPGFKCHPSRIKG